MDFNKSSIYYFAYGSNINLNQIKKRCPKAKFVNVGRLKSFRLVFNKICGKRRFDLRFANIKPSTNNLVEGYVYEMSIGELNIMDKYECYPEEYDRKELRVSIENKEIIAWVYIAQNNKIANGLPYKTYLENITDAQLISKGYKTKLKGVYKFVDWFTKENNDPFDIFNNLWTSFNNYYNSVFYQSSMSESKTLERLKNNQNMKNIFQELLKNTNFNELLSQFRRIIRHEDGNYYVEDMRDRKKIKYNDGSSFEQFIDVMYQIRCNTVHGEKTPSGPNDQNIVKTAGPVLQVYLKNLYEPFL